MRNLKRTLSLALAAFMLLGMMVVSASASDVYDSFSDKAEIVNKDAVSMLTILDIINGKDDGSFDPNGDVTRAEMAKMIAVILNKGVDNNDLYTGLNTGLTDVSGHWAEGNINYCYTRNIIAGRGDGTFDPGAQVTASEAAKMLLVAAGYNPDIEGFVGNAWAVNVNAKASALGIFDGYTGNVLAPLNRDDAALLIYNALDVEMIESYSTNNYALVYGDRRTILGEMYGVYKVKGVVIGNEWAQLEGTDYDESLADGKTRLADITVYMSNTLGTNPGTSTNPSNTNVEQYKDTNFNVSTPVDYLGKTVTMYIRKTTVLADSEVLGVYLREEDNNVKESTVNQTSLTDFLKNSGMKVGDETAYDVNYGEVASESAANDILKLDTLKVTGGNNIVTNKYGIELTVIDNDDNGIVDYVLWVQEDLTQITSLNESKKTITFLMDTEKKITSYNYGKSIDLDDVVFVDDADEGDVVLVRTYGGRYYVSQPEVVSGKMDSYSASKDKEQYIVVGGETYRPSYINTTAGGEVDELTTFDVAKCAKTDGVQWDVNYDFYLDSHGYVAAFKPNEKVSNNYALILNSGYNPGVYSSDASGKVTVLLADGTEDTFSLNFSASATNLRKQIEAATSAGHTKTDDGIAELKGFLGTDYTDQSATRPWNDDVDGGANSYNDLGYTFAGVDEDNNPSTTATDYKAGKAAGYVITYSMDDNNVLTIESVVGTYDASKPGNDLGAYVAGAITTNYSSGAAQVVHAGYPNGNGWENTAIDLDTVAFYYYEDSTGVVHYSVATGYSKMESVKASSDADKSEPDFIATNVGAKYTDGFYQNNTGTNLAEMILFNAKGKESDKSYVYILGRNNHYDSGNYVDVYGILEDGTAVTLKLTRNNFNERLGLDNGDESNYNKVYQYSTNANGISTLADPELPSFTSPWGTYGDVVVTGYALRLLNGTVAFNRFLTDLPGNGGSDTLPTQTTYWKAYALAKANQVWNVTDLAIEEDAPAGSFSTTRAKHAILVLDNTGTKINAAFLWDIEADELTEALAITIAASPDTINVSSSTTLTATVSHAVGGTTVTWYPSDSSGNKTGAALGTGSSLTVTGTDLGTGTKYVIAEVVDASSATATSAPASITVSESSAGKTLGHSANNAYKVFADDSVKSLSWEAARTGYVVEIPEGTTTVSIQDSTNWNEGEHYLSTEIGKVYTVDADKCITIDVEDLESTIGSFTKCHVLTLSDGITLQENAKIHEQIEGDKTVIYVETGASDVKLTFPATGAAVAIVVDSASKVQDLAANAIKNGTTAISSDIDSDLWIKGAASVTLASGGVGGSNPTVEVDDQGTALANSADYVAIGTTLYVTASNSGETVTASGTGVTATDLEEVENTDPQEYTYVVTAANVTLTDSST